jgi:hypothetical protein
MTAQQRQTLNPNNETKRWPDEAKQRDQTTKRRKRLPDEGVTVPPQPTPLHPHIGLLTVGQTMRNNPASLTKANNGPTKAKEIERDKSNGRTRANTTRRN